MARSLRKKQTLTDKKSIDNLFIKGKVYQNFPLRLYCVPANETKVLFTVSKKKLPRAVDRNKIKRHLKEIFFQNLFQKENNKFNIGFVYLSSKLMNHKELSEKMKQLWFKINK